MGHQTTYFPFILSLSAFLMKKQKLECARTRARTPSYRLCALAGLLTVRDGWSTMSHFSNVILPLIILVPPPVESQIVPSQCLAKPMAMPLAVACQVLGSVGSVRHGAYQQMLHCLPDATVIYLWFVWVSLVRLRNSQKFRADIFQVL